MITKLLWLIRIICLSATAAFLIEPEKVEGVKYLNATKAAMTSEYMRMPNAVRMGHVEGATYLYPNGSVEIAVNDESLLRNWVLRHENCHARQLLENRERSEIECSIKMLEPN